ncbi:MAG: Tat pathway signal protein [Rhizobiales bacterium]|nr:Tat pathway signal protein [Hyphomicrobiales bacterium]
MPTRREMLGLALAALAAGRSTDARAAVLPSPGFSHADLKQRTFCFFWDTTDPKTGLAPDRWPTKSFSSIAAVGFALTAYPIGVANGWITRAAARERTLATLRFFANAPQGPEARGRTGHMGFFYHFLSMETGMRFETTEISTIDTALLLGGMLFAQSWFDGDEPDEAEIRRLANAIYGRVDWTWIRPRAPFVSMGWHPETGYIPHDWNRYTESLLLYVLALGSPTHSLDGADWQRWTDTFDLSWGPHFGEPHIGFAPLFGHQYSHVWIDFRGIRDAYGRRRGLDYFENSRRATFAQRNYAIQNPGGWAGYGRNVWGLTACDGPGDFKRVIGGREREFFSYSARGPMDRDDGTLAPTAAAASIAFAPEIVVPALAEMHRRYGSGIYGKYGFRDSFNPSLTTPKGLRHGGIVPGVGWVDGDHLGINQGPIVAMLENHNTGLVWKTMRNNPHIRRGLTRAGFTGGWLA